MQRLAENIKRKNMKLGKFLLSLLIITLTFSIYSCSKASTNCGASVDCNSVTYASTIKPLVASKCGLSGCHGSSFSSYSGIQSIANSGALYNTVVANESMPAGNISMSCEERAQIECWVNAGAPNN